MSLPFYKQTTLTPFCFPALCNQLEQAQKHGQMLLLQNKRRKKLGILNATKNASVAKSTPKMRAINISRTNPRIREISVILLTIAVDLKSWRLKVTPFVTR